MGWIEDIKGAIGGALGYVSGVGAAVGRAAYDAGASVTAPPPLASPKPSPTPASPPPPVVVVNPVTEATQYYNENYSITTPGQTVATSSPDQSQGSGGLDVFHQPKILTQEYKGSPGYELSKLRMATGDDSIGRYMGADYGKHNIPGFVPYNTPETIAMVTQKAELIGREYQAGNISHQESVARINELARQYNLTPQSVSGVVSVGAQKEQVDQIISGRINPRATYDVEYRTPGRVTEGADWAKHQIVPGIALMQPELLPQTERFMTGEGSVYTKDTGNVWPQEGAYQYLGPYDVTQHGQTERGWLYKSEKGAYFVAEPPKVIGQEVPMSGGPAAWGGMLGSKRLELTSLTPSMPGAIPVSAREVGTGRTFQMETPAARLPAVAGSVGAEPSLFAASAGEGIQIFDQAAMFPTVPQFPSTRVSSAEVVSAKPPGAMINLFDIPGLGLAANLRVAAGKSPLISAETEPGRFLSYATGGIYKTVDMMLGILPGHPSIAPAGLVITVPSEKPVRTFEVGSPKVTISGGNQTITQLGTWLETNKPLVQTPEQAAVYNKYVDVYNEMSRQNPLVETTTRTMMTTGEPDKVYKYGQWDIYSEKAGAAFRNLTGGYSEEQLKAYGQTLQSQKGIQGDINRIIYGAGEFLGTKPLDVLPAAAAGATFYIGGVAVGGALETVAQGTGILATGARILTTPGTGGLPGAAVRFVGTYAPLVYLGGLGTYDVTEGFTAPREKIEMNIGKSLIPGYAMLFGAVAPGMAPAVASTRIISQQGVGGAYVRGINIGGESVVYGRTSTGRFNVGWGRPGDFVTYTFGREGGIPPGGEPIGGRVGGTSPVRSRIAGFLTGEGPVVPSSGAMMMRTEPVGVSDLRAMQLHPILNEIIPVGAIMRTDVIAAPSTILSSRRNLGRFLREPAEFAITSDVSTGKIISAVRGKAGLTTPEVFETSLKLARSAGAENIFLLHTHPRAQAIGNLVLEYPSDIDVSGQPSWRNYAKEKYGINIKASGVVSEEGVSLFNIPSTPEITTGGLYSSLIEKHMNLPEHLLGTGGTEYYTYEKAARGKALSELSKQKGVLSQFISFPYPEYPMPTFDISLAVNAVPVGKYPPPAMVLFPGMKGGEHLKVGEAQLTEPYYQRGGPIGKFLDTTPTGWFKTPKVENVINIPPTDAVRYGALESMIPSVPLLETSKQLIAPGQWYTHRRTVTTLSTSPAGVIASQTVPSGRTSTVSFKPGTLVEGSPEAWTEAARSMIKITRGEGILINPYSGETIVMGRREITRVPGRTGVPEVETGKATFNIYNLPSSLKIVSGGEKIPTPDIGDITAVSFRTKFLESGAYRDLLRSGRGTVYQYITTPERYGVVRQTREVSSAISDFLTAKEPEVMDIYRYEKLPTPKHPVKLVILGSPVNLVGKFVSGLDIAGMKSEGLSTITMPSKVSREPVVSSGGQVLVYPGITTEEKLSAALQSIFEELKKAQKKPFIKESREGATVSARISRATTEQRNIAEFPAQRERLGRLQQRLPSREEVIPVSINYERYNQAMFKVMRSEEYLKGVGLQGAGEEISGITVMGHAIARGMSEGDTTGVSTRLGRMMGIEVGIAGVKGVSTRTSTSTALDEVAEQRSKIIIGLAEITDELSRVGKEEVLKKGEKETPEEKKDLYIIPRTDITTIPRTDITPKIDTKITTDIIPKIIITPVPTIIIPPVGGISGGGGAGASPRRLYTRHTQLFDYPFDPWAAARETMKVLRKGSASLTGKIPKSSVSTSVVIPKSATVPVTKMPKSGSLPSSLPKGSNKVAEKNKSKKNKRKS